MPPPPSPGGASLATISTAPAATLPRKVEPPASAEKRGGSGSVVKRGGSGSDTLPSLPDIQWEKRTDRPGYGVWFAPDGPQAHRNTKTYLGYVGKRLLAEWEALPESERLTTISVWVADRRAGKGV